MRKRATDQVLCHSDSLWIRLTDSVGLECDTVSLWLPHNLTTSESAEGHGIREFSHALAEISNRGKWESLSKDPERIECIDSFELIGLTPAMSCQAALSCNHENRRIADWMPHHTMITDLPKFRGWVFQVSTSPMICMQSCQIATVARNHAMWRIHEQSTLIHWIGLILYVLEIIQIALIHRATMCTFDTESESNSLLINELRYLLHALSWCFVI